MTYEYDAYINTIDEMEHRIEDDDKFPVVEDGTIKMIFKIVFEFLKMILNCLKYNIINAPEKEKQF